SAALAASHAVPMPPLSGTRLSRSSRTASNDWPRAAAIPPTAIGVSTRPRAIALQRIPREALDWAIDVVRRLTPAFDTSYATWKPPATDAAEEMFTIEPLPRSRIAGSIARQVRHIAV